MGRSGQAGTSCDSSDEKGSSPLQRLALFRAALQRSADNDERGAVAKLISASKRSGSAGGMPVQDLVAMARLTQVALEQLSGSTRPLRIVETGFATGYSSRAMLAAACDSLKPAHVTSIDPYQSTAWGSGGLKNVAAFLKAWEPSCPNVLRHSHAALPSGTALSDIQRAGECVDLALVDGGHKFDEVMLDIYYLVRLLRQGGVLVIHDTLMPSTASALSFLQRNLPFKPIRLTATYAAYVKVRADERLWNFHAPFNGNYSGTSGKRHIFIRAAEEIS